MHPTKPVPPRSVVPPAHLDHHVLHEIVLKALELQLQHRREALKQDALARVLQGVRQQTGGANEGGSWVACFLFMHLFLQMFKLRISRACNLYAR